jgi:hypothetical protein
METVRRRDGSLVPITTTDAGTETDAGTGGPPRRKDPLRWAVHLLLTAYLLPAICLVILVGLMAVLADGLARACVRLAHRLPCGRGGRCPSDLAAGGRENRPRGPLVGRNRRPGRPEARGGAIGGLPGRPRGSVHRGQAQPPPDQGLAQADPEQPTGG